MGYSASTTLWFQRPPEHDTLDGEVLLVRRSLLVIGVLLVLGACGQTNSGPDRSVASPVIDASSSRRCAARCRACARVRRRSSWRSPGPYPRRPLPCSAARGPTRLCQSGLCIHALPCRRRAAAPHATRRPWSRAMGPRPIDARSRLMSSTMYVFACSTVIVLPGVRGVGAMPGAWGLAALTSLVCRGPRRAGVPFGAHEPRSIAACAATRTRRMRHVLAQQVS